MKIAVESRRRSTAALEREHPEATVIDVTSKGTPPWLQFSPFYPHGGIPVPFSPGVTSQSVEGIWQSLKVFVSADVDPSKLTVSTMKGIKRTVRRNGQILGHRAGITGDRLLSYVEARRRIYLPSYRFVLVNKIPDLVTQLRNLAREGEVVLLDYTTNGDVNDISTPLSHAALIRYHLIGDWPL